MKYYNLIETLKNISASHQIIQEFGEGDVYEYMNSGNHKYPCLFMTMSTINSDTSSTDYNFTLFYIDRLTDDNSNRIYVQSTGISVIQQILQQIVSLNSDVELTSANYTLFTEKFADYCGGAFCEVVLSDVLQNTINDTDDCDETDFGDLQMTITKNGVYNVSGYSTAVVKIDSLVLVKMTQNEYDNLEEYDKFTVYIILDDKNVITRIYKGTEIIYDITQTNYVTFTAEQANSTIGLAQLSTNQTLEYSTDTTNWNTMDTSTSISLPNVGDKVYIRGILSANNSTYDYTQFNMTGKIAASGNCNAIWNYQDIEAPLKNFCGYNLFNGCSSLVEAPELPATTLDEHCYYSMFQNCTSLTTAPTLPATTLLGYCYTYMFYGCSKLNKITCLANDDTVMADAANWVWGVSSTGTFIKHPDMTAWSTGVSGIPKGWTVEDYVG